jgi:hypothetical protein
MSRSLSRYANIAPLPSTAIALCHPGRGFGSANYLPGQLEQRLAQFVDYYNLRRHHESLNNLTPADVYFGRAQTILTRRENIKLKPVELRRRQRSSSPRSLTPASI